MSFKAHCLGNQQPTITTHEATTTTSNLERDNNSDEGLIPREEFEIMDDPNSLEDIVIYDVVVEYQGIVTSTTHTEEDIIEIKLEPTEKNKSVIMLRDSSQTLIPNSDVLEFTTMSQVVIAHEEEVLAQSFGERAIPPTDVEHQPPSNNKWGSLQTKKPKDLSQWQQGYMSRQEVSGEATTSVASAQPTHSSVANPHYKKSNLESNRLNQLVSNISPPAKERKEDTNEQSYQHHKQKKG